MSLSWVNKVSTHNKGRDVKTHESQSDNWQSLLPTWRMGRSWNRSPNRFWCFSSPIVRWYQFYERVSGVTSPWLDGPVCLTLSCVVSENLEVGRTEHNIRWQGGHPTVRSSSWWRSTQNWTFITRSFTTVPDIRHYHHWMWPMLSIRQFVSGSNSTDPRLVSEVYESKTWSYKYCDWR